MDIMQLENNNNMQRIICCNLYVFDCGQDYRAQKQTSLGNTSPLRAATTNINNVNESKSIPLTVLSNKDPQLRYV